jgi:hypothetical protein
LFVSYGEHWLKGRSSFKDVPLYKNYKESNAIAGALWSLLELDGAAISKDVIPSLVTAISETLVDQHRTRIALNHIEDGDSLEHIIEKNGTARLTINERSVDWLDENGYCLDHIFVKPSSIDQAGMGAFARRPLPKGFVINSAPVVATHRSYLDLNTTFPINSKKIMMNYHIGHKNSSILFFPTTQMIAINHDPTEYNARLEFSKRDPKTQYLLGRPLKDIFAEKYSALLLDVIATRDIKPDEEVLIDYGVEWEKAWNDHVKKWKTPCKKGKMADCYESSKFIMETMNSDKHNPKYRKWTDTHLGTCQVNSTFPWTTGEIMFLKNTSNPVHLGIHNDPKVQKEYLGYTFENEGFDYPYLALGNPRPCKVITSDPGNDTLDVVMFFHTHQIPSEYRRHENLRAVVRVKDLPSGDFRYLTKPLKWDWHSPKAFRHEIHFPDDVFPKLWRDLE